MEWVAIPITALVQDPHVQPELLEVAPVSCLLQPLEQLVVVVEVELLVVEEEEQRVVVEGAEEEEAAAAEGGAANTTQLALYIIYVTFINHVLLERYPPIVRYFHHRCFMSHH